MEDVPRIEPEDGPDHHSHGDAVQQQTDDQLDESARAAVNWYRGEQAHATTLTETGLDIQYHLRETGPYERDHTDLGGNPGSTPRHRRTATPASLPTGAWPTGFGRRYWTAGSPSAPVCPANVNWQWDFRCPVPPSAPPTHCCGNRAGWTPDAGLAAGSGCPTGNSARHGSSSPSTAVASFNAGGIFGWQDGVGWHESVPASAAPPAMIDLTTACLPAPAAPLAAAVQVAAEQLSRYMAGDGYLPFGLPVLREVIAARYAAAGVPTTAEQILITSGAQHAFSPRSSASCRLPATGC